ncbi:MAG: glycosyltransferase [Terriglobia bacterium]
MVDLMNPPPPTAPLTLSLDAYQGVVGASEIAELRNLARQLAGRSMKMVNSTAVGGGVAEILNRLLPLLQDLGLDARREIMTGGDDFFEVTKGFHNALHGAPYEPQPRAFDIFRAYTEQNLAQMEFNEDFIVIHDPQPAGLIAARDRSHAPWIWRCHIDASQPHPAVWDFLHEYVRRYDATIFSSANFTRGLQIPQYRFYPSIDPLAEKNHDLEPAFIQQTLEKFHIDPELPILTQVSRFDRLKDPLGVIQAYRMVRRYFSCQLVLVGGGAKDDPEGGQVLAEVREAAANDPHIHILDLPPWSALEINALQRASTIIIQKSLREGFGLTVTEGLWKKKPVVASAVGGIPAQVIHKITGMLTHSIEGTAFQIRYLLSNPAFAQQLAENGQQHVRSNFLITSNLKRYLLLCLLHAPRSS